MAFEHLKVSTLLLGSAGPGPAEEVRGGGDQGVLETVVHVDVGQPSVLADWTVEVARCELGMGGKGGEGRKHGVWVQV